MSERHRVRLVGGPADERIIEVRDDLRVLKVPIAAEFTAASRVIDLPARPGYTEHVYVRQDSWTFVWEPGPVRSKRSQG